MIGVTWKRVKDKRGHAPIRKNLDLVCRYCKVSLQMRYSTIYPVPCINEVAWKCPRCAWWQRFDIKDTKEYIEEVVKRRNNKFWYVPKLKEWSKEDETARQLEGLGYFGGR